MKPNNLPLPPDQLAIRVGGTAQNAFEEQGRGAKEFIISSLPENYDFTNKRVLDFGCGSGRILRHFNEEARKAEFWACDIDSSSISWLSENFPSYFRFICNTETADLPLESNYFDLIYVVSVFTHLTTTWRSWLLELRRILKPGGILLVTFHNRIAYEYNTGQHFDEEKTGMLAMHEDRPWSDGGPMIYHSNWWLQKNFGQLFDVDYISREGLFVWQSLAFLIKPENTTKGKGKRQCPVLQPYPYQFYDPQFSGHLNVPNRRSSFLRSWHGIELEPDNNREITLSGWFVSKTGRISNIQFIVDESKIMELPGANRDRKDVEAAHPDWPDSLHSGFEATLKLIGYGNGEHELKVIATDLTGRRHEIQSPLILLRGKDR